MDGSRPGDPAMSPCLPAKRKVDELLSAPSEVPGSSEANQLLMGNSLTNSRVTAAGGNLSRVGESSSPPCSGMGVERDDMKGDSTPMEVDGQGTRAESCFEGPCGISSTNKPGVVPSCGAEAQSLRNFDLQFFVRHFQNGKTLVVTAKPTDTVETVLQQLGERTGITCYEQRLLLAGRQLYEGATLADLGVQRNCTLQLVARMRSTNIPQVFQIVADIVENCKWLGLGPQRGTNDSIMSIYQGKAREDIFKFLAYAAETVRDGKARWEYSLAEYMEAFRLAGGTKALVALLHSVDVSNREFADESIRIFAEGSPRFASGVTDFFGPLLVDFCNLLKGTLPDHELFGVCQNTLVNLLEKLGVAHGTARFRNSPEWALGNLAPYLHELAFKLQTSLSDISSVAAGQASELHHPLELKDVKVFTAFAVAVSRAISDCPPQAVSTNSALLTEPMKGPGMTCNLGSGHPDSPRPLKSRWPMQPPSCTSQTLGADINCTWEAFHARHMLQMLQEALNTCLEESRKLALRLLQLNEMGRGSASLADREKRALALMPEAIKNALPGLLKGLHAVAKLHTDSERAFVKLLERHRDIMNMIIKIRMLLPEGELSWLPDYRHVLEADVKKRWVATLLPVPSGDLGQRLLVEVKRGPTLLADSLEAIVYAAPESLKEGIVLRFSDEEGAGVGVLREWFALVVRALFNPANALFVSGAEDKKRFCPSAASGINPGHLMYFRFAGRVMALALQHHIHIDATFAPAFFKQLAGRPVDWRDLRDVDPVLYKSCNTILEMDPVLVDMDALGLTFSWTVEELGSQTDIELCPGGASVKVTSTNRQRFIDLLVQRRLCTSVTKQVRAFAEGFAEMLSRRVTLQQFLAPLEATDFEALLFGGDQELSVEDWKAVTEYHGFSETDQLVRWFWQVVGEMSAEQRRCLLFFATSISRLPPEGFAGLPSAFHLHRADEETRDRLPTAHTCFQQLLIPPYASLEVLRKNLHIVIEDHVVESFGFA